MLSAASPHRMAALTIIARTVAVLLGWVATTASAVEQVIIYTYHIHPPFIVEGGTGLTYDLADYLTGHSDGRFQFEVAPMSRPRLNAQLYKPIAGIVPWVEPAFFKDSAETKYLWTQQVLMHDSSQIVSTRESSVVYEGPLSLAGLIFGGIRGHVYSDIDKTIGKGGAIRRVDSDSHKESFEKLFDGRVDVTLLPGSSTDFLIWQNDAADYVFVSPKPHSRTARRVLVLNQRADLREFIDHHFAAAGPDAEWANICQKYR
jgi:polar amino acid transport system substrate-binding protein